MRGLQLIATARRGARDLSCLHGRDCAARKVRASASEVNDDGGYGHPLTHRQVFSEGQKDYRTIGTGSLEPFEPLRGGASGGPKEPVPTIPVLELTSPGPLRPGANSPSLRRKRARRAARRQQRLSDLPRREPPLREVSAVGRVVTADRHDGERTRLTKNSARYEHVLAHDLWVSIEAALPHEHFSSSENASKQLVQR